MSCVFQDIDPPPSSPPLLRGEDGLGSIFWKTQDTALYESSLGLETSGGSFRRTL
jgi:hypothetical protein